MLPGRVRNGKRICGHSALGSADHPFHRVTGRNKVAFSVAQFHSEGPWQQTKAPASKAGERTGWSAERRTSLGHRPCAPDA